MARPYVAHTSVDISKNVPTMTEGMESPIVVYTYIAQTTMRIQKQSYY